jgi:hypothetical protein
VFIWEKGKVYLWLPPMIILFTVNYSATNDIFEINFDLDMPEADYLKKIGNAKLKLFSTYTLLK